MLSFNVTAISLNRFQTAYLNKMNQNFMSNIKIQYYLL